MGLYQYHVPVHVPYKLCTVHVYPSIQASGSYMYIQIFAKYFLYKTMSPWSKAI